MKNLIGWVLKKIDIAVTIKYCFYNTKILMWNNNEKWFITILEYNNESTGYVGPFF